MPEHEGDLPHPEDLLPAADRRRRNFDSFEEQPVNERSLPRDELGLFKDFSSAVLLFAEKIRAIRQNQKGTPAEALPPEVDSSQEFAAVRTLGRRLPAEMRNHILRGLQQQHPDLPILDLLPHIEK